MLAAFEQETVAVGVCYIEPAVLGGGVLRCTIYFDIYTSVIEPMGIAAGCCGVLLCDARAAVAEVPENDNGLNQRGGSQCKPGGGWAADLDQFS